LDRGGHRVPHEEIAAFSAAPSLERFIAMRKRERSTKPSTPSANGSVDTRTPSSAEAGGLKLSVPRIDVMRS
jgi:hypothetical protein